MDAAHGYLQLLIFLALLAGFAVKVPLVPLHTWLPLAHTQAPTGGSIDLAGILLKLGTYGILRFCLPMLPDATAMCMPMAVVAGGGRHRLRRAGVAGADRSEKADRLQQRQPHGLCDPRFFRPQPA